MEYDVLKRAADFISEFKYTGKDRTRAKELVSDIHRILEIHREREIISGDETPAPDILHVEPDPTVNPPKRSFLKKFFL
jgi:hypothetical protein